MNFQTQNSISFTDRLFVYIHTKSGWRKFYFRNQSEISLRKQYIVYS